LMTAKCLCCLHATEQLGEQAVASYCKLLLGGVLVEGAYHARRSFESRKERIAGLL
jgi:hypothetical protein